MLSCELSQAWKVDRSDDPVVLQHQLGEKKNTPYENTSKQEVLQCVYSCGTVIRAHPMRSCAHLSSAPVNPARLPLRLKAVYSTCQPGRRPRPAAAAQCAAKTNTDLFSLLGKMVVNSVQASGAFCLLLLFQRLLFRHRHREFCSYDRFLMEFAAASGGKCSCASSLSQFYAFAPPRPRQSASVGL